MTGSYYAKKQALKQAIREVIAEIESIELWDISAKLVASMPKRLRAVDRAKGY